MATRIRLVNSSRFLQLLVLGSRVEICYASHRTERRSALCGRKWSSTASFVNRIPAQWRRWCYVAPYASHPSDFDIAPAMASKAEDPDVQPPASKKRKSKGKGTSWLDEADFSEKTVAESSDGSGETFTFFFGKDSPFSQWHPAEFEVEGVTYNCAEQYMMHQKAVLFGDGAVADKILKSSDPKEQKALGRKVSNFDPDTWNKESLKIVKDGSRAKNPKLKEALLATSGTTMVEAAPRDTIWGIGLGGKNPKARDRTQWRGKNQLGQILTEVREELIASTSSKSD